MRHCLILSKHSAWTNHRNHALKAEALLSLSESGRGFGSLFHHHLKNTNHFSGWYFLPTAPCSRGAAWVPVDFGFCAALMEEEPEVPMFERIMGGVMDKLKKKAA